MHYPQILHAHGLLCVYMCAYTCTHTIDEDKKFHVIGVHSGKPTISLVAFPAILLFTVQIVFPEVHRAHFLSGILKVLCTKHFATFGGKGVYAEGTLILFSLQSKPCWMEISLCLPEESLRALHLKGMNTTEQE